MSGELAHGSTGDQYLTFVLGEESYGVDILRVQEIKGWTPVTRIPNSPDYLRGVLNLRGTIVPIIDLRMRFNMDNVEYTPVTVVIVVSVRSETRERIIGMVVDAVSDVLSVSAEDIRETPDFGGAVSTEYIRGLASVADQMVMLLDIDKMLTEGELKSLAAVSDVVAE
ncbi:chemotaxis protein CheW [Solemya pervernicosa gill symbiont]|uniref:Chemotaxis protein CheW n=1 Tax=Solemya pervernicosa gill symbiont TaxID=642797 RepID=A0A1T2L0F8_9GAMM|nr:chemotaxis protein CheW [Solemya pervernicosa gill symbiont]